MQTMKTCVLTLAAVLMLAASNQAAIETIYYDNFDGKSGDPLNGTTPDVTTGGATWQAGAAVDADGTMRPMFTAVLPFTPSIGTVYELSATFDNQGDWAAIGFLTTISNLETRILDNSVRLWCLTRQADATNKDQAFLGPGTTGPLGDASTISAAELKIRLETKTETEWLVTWYFDGVQGFQQTVDPSGFQIAYAAFGANGALRPMGGTVRSFTLAEIVGPPIATHPVPADQATDVVRDGVLGWRPGKFAKTHDVYLGTVFDDVNNASRTDPMGLLVVQGQDANTYDPAGLFEFGQTYYWRVDEINAPPDSTVLKGKTWTFTAETYGSPVKPVKATASSSSNALMGPEKTIDGSGLDASDQHATVASQMWLSKKNVSPVWIQYEFDKVYKLHEMWVWNSNQAVESSVGFGAKDVTIQTSLDGSTWTAIEDVPEFAQATGEPNYVHNTTVEFGGVQAKYVKLAIASNWADGTKQAGLSEVRFFYVPVKAFGPAPATGATGVAIDAVLNWRPGREAVRHEVYLGTDPNALTLVQTVTDHRCAIRSLGVEYGRTYYWKVNEVNDTATPTSWMGDIWSFSIPDHVVVDDFEGYNDRCNRVFFSWVDGFGSSGSADCGVAASSGNGTGSTVGNVNAPFAEQTIVLGGRQSMPFSYDNTAGKGYSEAVRTFDVAQDWTKGGAKTLVLYFHGGSDNGAGQLYVKINNVRVDYNGNAAAITLPMWKQWNVDLTSVSGLQAVKTLAVGVSGSSKGVLYIDDILLYRVAPGVAVATDPGTASLQAYYPLDGSANDGSGHGYNGTVVGNQIYADAPSGRGKAIQLNGTNDYLELPIGTLISSLTSTTVAAWVDFSNTGTGWERVFDLGTGTTNYMCLTPRQGTTGAMTFAIMTTTVAEKRFVAPRTLGTGWHHVAVVMDSATMKVRVYLDGTVVASDTTTVLPKDLGKTTQNWLGRSQFTADGYFGGMLDEVRIYNRALSDGEVRYLVGERP